MSNFPRCKIERGASVLAGGDRPLDPREHAQLDGPPRQNPARSLLTCIAISIAATLALAVSTSATPLVKLKVEPLPIPRYPGTGYILGHGAALKAEYTISGTEYGGFPPPLIGVNVYLPSGTKLHPGGFPTCPPATLESSGQGPKHCPKGSSAGPRGSVAGYVAFGDEIVSETATVEPFYAPDGGLEFFTFGHSPVLIEILSSGRYLHVNSAGFRDELTF